MAQQIQTRRDTAANWTAINPLLADGEQAYEKDTKKFKIGDGVTLWNALPYNVTGSALVTKNQGTNLTTGTTSLNFVGSGVTASTTGNDVTVTISGGSSGIPLVVCKASISAAQAITSDTWTKVLLNNASAADVGGAFNLATNRIIPTVAGWYQVDFAVTSLIGSAWTRIICRADKNGANAIYGTSTDLPSTNNGPTGVGTGLVYMNGTTDYFELFAFMSGSGMSLSPGFNMTHLSVVLVNATSNVPAYDSVFLLMGA